MAQSVTRAGRPGLAPAVAVSVLVHGALIAVVAYLAANDRVALPPVYKIDLVAAPAGPRSVGQVQPAAAPAPKVDAPVPKSPDTKLDNPVRKAAPPPKRTPPPPATRVPNAASAKPNTPAPKAGGGPVGSTGSDVTNIRSEGIAFPFPGYLNNIANQIVLNFETTDPRPLSAEVFFLIQRDGRVTEFEFRKRSGSSAFDIAARGAVEAAGRSRSFGPLPEGFRDDVLPVIFTFTPQMLR